jgi:hypothetical protein
VIGKWEVLLLALKLLQKCFFIIFMKESGIKSSGVRKSGGG